MQATKEVQLAAQRVLKQNVRLRELLRRIGFDDGFIDAWVRQDDCGNCDQPRQHSEKEGVCKLISKARLMIQLLKYTRVNMLMDSVGAFSGKRLPVPDRREQQLSRRYHQPNPGSLYMCIKTPTSSRKDIN